MSLATKEFDLWCPHLSIQLSSSSKFKRTLSFSSRLLGERLNQRMISSYFVAPCTLLSTKRKVLTLQMHLLQTRRNRKGQKKRLRTVQCKDLLVIQAKLTGPVWLCCRCVDLGWNKFKSLQTCRSLGTSATRSVAPDQLRNHKSSTQTSAQCLAN
jgi:hypothetical protein